MALVTFALKNYINIGTGILAFGIFTLTTVFLALIFVPKVSDTVKGQLVVENYPKIKQISVLLNVFKIFRSVNFL